MKLFCHIVDSIFYMPQENKFNREDDLTEELLLAWQKLGFSFRGKQIRHVYGKGCITMSSGIFRAQNTFCRCYVISSNQNICVVNVRECDVMIRT